MRLQRKHDVQNRGKREQRTTRNKNTVIHGVGIAAIRNRRTTWRGTCRSPTAQQPQRKPDTVSGRARKTRKWRWMQPTRLPGDRRSGGRRSRIPVRTGCGRQENESPHPQCHPAFFTPHAHPGKSKTSPDQLTKRRFQYPEPGFPDEELTIRPATPPAKASSTEKSTRFSKASALIEATAPVMSFFRRAP